MRPRTAGVESRREHREGLRDIVVLRGVLNGSIHKSGNNLRPDSRKHANIPEKSCVKLGSSLERLRDKWQEDVEHFFKKRNVVPALKITLRYLLLITYFSQYTQIYFL